MDADSHQPPNFAAVAGGQTLGRPPVRRTGIAAAFKYALAVSRRTPVASSMRRSDQPSRPSARTCCCLGSLKTLLMGEGPCGPAGVNVSARYAWWPVFRCRSVARIWVSTEGRGNCRRAATERAVTRNISPFRSVSIINCMCARTPHPRGEGRPALTCCDERLRRNAWGSSRPAPSAREPFGGIAKCAGLAAYGSPSAQCGTGQCRSRVVPNCTARKLLRHAEGPLDRFRGKSDPDLRANAKRPGTRLREPR